MRWLLKNSASVVRCLHDCDCQQLTSIVMTMLASVGRAHNSDMIFPLGQDSVIGGEVDSSGMSPLSPSCLDFLSKILVADPALRASTQEIMAHPWFTQVGPT